jgi:hypothetical protein
MNDMSNQAGTAALPDDKPLPPTEPGAEEC